MEFVKTMDMDMDINQSKDFQLLINIDVDFNRTIQNLVDKKEYFKNIHPLDDMPTRILNINRYSFLQDDSECRYRANYSYYSHEFENLLKRNKIDTTNSNQVYDFFRKEKDNLPDLGCILQGYF
jgi:hypothetical protein